MIRAVLMNFFFLFLMLISFPLLAKPLQTLDVALGEYPPYNSEILPGYGSISKKFTKIAQKMGYEVKYHFMPWARAMKTVEQGQMPVSIEWAKVPEREAKVLFPQNPIDIQYNAAFYSQKKYPNGLPTPIQSFEEMKPYTLVGILGYWYIPRMEKLGFDLHLVGDTKLALRMLKLGRRDLLYDSIETINATLQDYPDQFELGEFAHTSPLGKTGMYPIFSRIDNLGPELRHLYDQVVSEMIKNGEL